MKAINNAALEDIYFGFEDLTAGQNVNNETNRVVEDTTANIWSMTERSGQIQVHNRFTHIGNFKYLVTFANSFDSIIRFEPIEPCCNDEYRHPELIPFWVNVGQICPIEWDPFGMWYAELIVDFQNAKNRLLNLSMLKEERHAGFAHMVVDLNMIPNPSVLEQRSNEGPTIIPVMPWHNGITNAVQVVGEDTPDAGWAQNMMQTFEKEISDIGFSNIARWQQNDGTMTASEAKIISQNSNMLFGLDADMLSVAEEDFRKNMWLRWLKEYLPEYDKKFVRIRNGLASNWYEITRSDLIGNEDPDVIVESKKVTLQRNKELLTFLTAREQAFMANPDVPSISKLMYRRDIETLAWLPREQVYRNNPYTADEDRALTYFRALNNYEKIKKADPTFTFDTLFEPWMDMFTYYIYLSNAKDSPKKRDIIAEIRRRMIKEGMEKKLQAMQWAPSAPGSPMAWVANSMTSQMTSNMIKNQNDPWQSTPL